MRKHIKNELLEICDNMIEAISYLKTNQSINLLADLQDVSEYIIQLLKEDNHGDVSISVVHLENQKNLSYGYQDMIDILIEFQKICYGYAMKLSEDSGKCNHDDYNKQLLLMIEEVNESIKIITPKIQIVFFPYNASMWDALESVYLSASNDEKVDAVVVPIPYYKIENNKRRLCYEADKFPSNIPVVDYRKYPLEDIKPDIAYIHNPYDKYNAVTQIVEPFCSYNLKKHIETLVYIPYYAPPENFDKHHYKLPAYRNVDYIILSRQSHKDVLSAYINQNKLLVLGTPKYDKITKLSNDISIMPDDWAIIADGRPIVYYSVGIIELLYYDDVAIDKMNMVFQRVQQRNDICLLFRPHPLYETTLKSMRPKLLDKYLSIKNNFIDNGIGIYDNTSDVTISVAISVGSLGEYSSVERLFEVQGKPTFHTNCNIIRQKTKEEAMTAFVMAVCVMKDKIWYVENYINKLCYIDRKTKERVEYMELSGDKNICSYSDILIVDDYIVICPSFSDEILLLNKDKNIKTIESGLANLSYSKIYQYQHVLYFIPCLSDEILAYDINAGEFKTIDIRSINNENIDSNKERVVNAHCLRDGQLYVASATTNKMLVVNLSTYEQNIYIISDIQGYSCMTVDGDTFYFSAISDGCIVRWNARTQNNDIIGNVNDIVSGDYPYLSSIMIYNNELILLPYKSNTFYKMDIKYGNIHLCENLFHLNFDVANRMYYYMDFDNITRQNGEMYIVYYRDMSIHILNENDGNVEKYSFKMKEPLQTELNPYGWGNNFKMEEDIINTIDEYFNYVSSDELRDERKKYFTSKLSDVELGSAGNNIHRAITYKEGI